MTANRSLDEFLDAGPEEPADDEGSAPDEGGSDASADGESSPVVIGDDRSEIATTETAGPTTDSSGDPDEADTAETEPPAPPSSTYLWSPDGGSCGVCGEAVEERWRDGDDLVCTECKEW